LMYKSTRHRSAAERWRRGGGVGVGAWAPCGKEEPEKTKRPRTAEIQKARDDFTLGNIFFASKIDGLTCVKM